ncbi:Asp-tRNA(Asn)/Glu-tRNA(Gln) amidotransferase subunit GatB [Fulvivirgaceae bacterium BMA10]|uniref:Aspartyl/glutamyl-tRNA(Asn/Gln) amidotransferase subunit B n=1 Tax=Splendidivirga corallicola TaxID=3051826 RepID=A0ABT8KJ60_9BACT|nr:Asp-tRNA(Asn)/Glu-tRNA(Gln) amidotransferase subunit GatB [Fulvivirgaceae bacterium BMA10]
MNKDILDKYEPIIGLEVHAQLSTKSKIFAGDSTAFGNEPNTQISVITLGHPGTLPRLNEKVVELAVKMGLACHCDITHENIFDRKNYFYPDLPKGYQITQDKTPICRNGYVTVKTKHGVHDITLTKIHLEEDAGKSIHVEGEDDTWVDFNRAGVPLIEIVTDPMIHSSEEASGFLTEVRRLVRYLEICDGNMEEGSMRCDANVSVRLKGDNELGKKVEVKNMNSIRNVQRAIDHEIGRQIKLLEANKEIVSETRTFNVISGTTSGMRTKEELNDYRYFPEPDLSPFIISDEWLNKVKSSLPSLPNELFDKFVKEFGLPEYDANVLIDNREIASYFETLCDCTKKYKAASNWMMGPVKSYLNEATLSIANFPLTPQKLGELIDLVEDGKVSFSVASQNIFHELVKEPNSSAYELAKGLNLLQDSDQSSIQPLIDETLKAFPEKVAAYKKGKKGLLGMFMSEVMKRGEGKIDPRLANELLRKSLG